MKITQNNFRRAARIATRRAVSFLAMRNLTGEANRARVMQDSWQRHAEEILGQANAKAIATASALTVCRQLTTAVKIVILKSEIRARKGGA
jgi:hypothetical protein